MFYIDNGKIIRRSAMNNGVESIVLDNPSSRMHEHVLDESIRPPLVMK